MSEKLICEGKIVSCRVRDNNYVVCGFEDFPVCVKDKDKYTFTKECLK